MRELLTRLLQGDSAAVELCLLVFDWWNHYDHLIDRDLPAEFVDDAIHDAMWKVSVEMPANPFYQRHQHELSVSIANAISTWKASVALQRAGGPKELELAHVLRWVPAEFFLHCARLVGGRAWADSVAPWFWVQMTKDHSFAEFVSESRGTHGLGT